MNTIIRFLCLPAMILLFSCGGRQHNTDQQVEAKSKDSMPKIDLHAAVVTDNYEVITQHIRFGSDLNALEPSRASTPLITCAAMGKVKAAKMLVDAGADLDYRNVDGSTALITAAVFGNTEIASILIGAGANLDIKNNQGSTALHTAAFFCREEIVRALLENGADKTLTNNTGQTALQTVEPPFEEVKPIYDAVGNALRPLGLVLDYDHIRTTRPKIAEMLR